MTTQNEKRENRGIISKIKKRSPNTVAIVSSTMTRDETKSTRLALSNLPTMGRKEMGGKMVISNPFQTEKTKIAGVLNSKMGDHMIASRGTNVTKRTAENASGIKSKRECKERERDRSTKKGGVT